MLCGCLPVAGCRLQLSFARNTMTQYVYTRGVFFRNGHPNNNEHKVVPMSQSDDVSNAYHHYHHSFRWKKKKQGHGCTGNGSPAIRQRKRRRTRQPHGHARAQPAAQEGRPHLPFLHRSVGRPAPAYVLAGRVVPTSSVPSDRHPHLVSLRVASHGVLPRQGKQSVQSLPAALAHQDPEERGGVIFARSLAL